MGWRWREIGRSSQIGRNRQNDFTVERIHKLAILLSDLALLLLLLLLLGHFINARLMSANGSLFVMLDAQRRKRKPCTSTVIF
jgi:hypothetical protein